MKLLPKREGGFSIHRRRYISILTMTKKRNLFSSESSESMITMFATGCWAAASCVVLLKAQFALVKVNKEKMKWICRLLAVCEAIYSVSFESLTKNHINQNWYFVPSKSSKAETMNRKTARLWVVTLLEKIPSLVAAYESIIPTWKADSGFLKFRADSNDQKDSHDNVGHMFALSAVGLTLAVVAFCSKRIVYYLVTSGKSSFSQTKLKQKFSFSRKKKDLLMEAENFSLPASKSIMNLF